LGGPGTTKVKRINFPFVPCLPVFKAVDVPTVLGFRFRHLCLFAGIDIFTPKGENPAHRKYYVVHVIYHILGSNKICHRFPVGGVIGVGIE
jgi:hypothetical protein